MRPVKKGVICKRSGCEENCDNGVFYLLENRKVYCSSKCAEASEDVPFESSHEHRLRTLCVKERKEGNCPENTCPLIVGQKVQEKQFLKGLCKLCTRHAEELSKQSVQDNSEVVPSFTKQKGRSKVTEEDKADSVQEKNHSAEKKRKKMSNMPMMKKKISNARGSTGRSQAKTVERKKASAVDSSKMLSQLEVLQPMLFTPSMAEAAREQLMRDGFCTVQLDVCIARGLTLEHVYTTKDLFTRKKATRCK